ncbi:MAG: hypothetical protein ACJ76H_11770 [Bacteriovoracaceae bacterium]
MKTLFPILILALSTFGCGEDYSSGRRPLIENDQPVTTEDNFLQASQLPRARGLDVMTTRFERDLIVAGSLPPGYRVVPELSTDDEGKHGVNVQTRTGLGRPTLNCGIIDAAATITQRIDDCVKQNNTSASWNGTSNGTNGESLWRLVARLGTNEIWLDTRTGLLWSDLVDTTNWCKASGNKEKNDTTDCSTEVTDTPSCIGAHIFTVANIQWRLPTRNDFLQADINGLRFVVREVTSTPYWTATLDSTATDRGTAWTYNQTQGTLEKATLITDRNVRCVGAGVL